MSRSSAASAQPPSGATGSVAAQLAKLTGARVVGIAGGDAKKAYLLEELKLDGAVDYKDKDKSVGAQLDELCPDGVDYYFDTVGGATLDSILVGEAHRAQELKPRRVTGRVPLQPSAKRRHRARHREQVAQ